VRVEATGGALLSVEIDAGAVGDGPREPRACGLTAGLRGGLVAVDNVISRADQVQELLALMAAEPAVTATQVPIGAGLQLAVKR
jgi:hypothetical protein